MRKKNKQPLERISLAGYKSFREINSFPLSPGLNVLIGANGSGKTNFIRFFELLANMLDSRKGLQNYISSHGGADAFLFRGMKMTREFRADLQFGSGGYKFALRGAADRSLFFAEESASSKLSRATVLKNKLGEGHKESVLARSSSPLMTTFQSVKETIQDWRVYHFHDTSPSAPVMGLSNVVDSAILHQNAANIAAFLIGMQKHHPEHYARVEETVRQVAPFFGAFVLKEVAPGQTQLLWQDRYSDLIYYPHQLSDGTVRYICLATLLLQPNPPATIVIDEPELGLHPQAIKLLASLLHETSGRAQLIVATQSSMLLDEFDPDQVIVANHRNGETTLERQDPKRLKAWLKEYTLGQLWEKNELGGQP